MEYIQCNMKNTYIDIILVLLLIIINNNVLGSLTLYIITLPAAYWPEGITLVQATHFLADLPVHYAG